MSEQLPAEVPIGTEFNVWAPLSPLRARQDPAIQAPSFSPFGPILTTQASIPFPFPGIPSNFHVNGASIHPNVPNMLTSGDRIYLPSLFSSASSLSPAEPLMINQVTSRLLPGFQTSQTQLPQPPPQFTRDPTTSDENRRQRKMEDLFKVQSFVQESRLVRETVLRNQDDPVREDLFATRIHMPLHSVPDMQQSQRSLSQTEGIENVAELRRNIAENYASKIANTTPKKSERIVSGVFVSYPQKRAQVGSSPIKESPQLSVGSEIEDGIISQFKPIVGKMTPEEYAQLRRNLLNRSEQHAVSN